MARRSQRNRRPSQANASARAPQPAAGNGNGGARYEKYLPEWMKGANGVPVRPPRPRRARQQRPVGGYTPGKLSRGDGQLG